MIRVIVQGGLGNQMFEYASAYALAKRSNSELVIDTSFINVYGNRSWCRPYELCIFALSQNAQVAQHSRLLVRILPRISQYCRKHNKFQLGRFLFDTENYEENRRSLILCSYFLYCHLFAPYRNELLQQFAFIQAPNAANNQLIEQMESRQSVSVHIRRGDYLNEVNQRMFWTPSVEWYRQAMEQISTQVPQPTYYFFSDDIKWVKQQFADIQNAVFVDINHGADSYNDMRLMSQCKHNIIANSTFSWWGAWLNTNPDKIVIAPSKFFVNEDSNTWYRRRMIPNGWTTL